MAYPVADLGCGEGGAAAGYVFGNESALDGLGYGLADYAGFAVEFEAVFEHEGRAEDGGEGIGDVFAGGLGVGAVDGFVNRRMQPG